MSHGDQVRSAARRASRCSRTARTRTSGRSAIATRPIYGVQFHPEVVHTPRGGELHRELPVRCVQGDAVVDDGRVHRGRGRRRFARRVGDARVICGLSGGVDSSVAAALVHRAIGDRSSRASSSITGCCGCTSASRWRRRSARTSGIELITVDASDRFLAALAGIEDPEEKRRRIGHTFIDVFEDAAAAAGHDAKFLVQGTLYPDVIESRGAARRPVGDDQDASQRGRPQAGHEVRADRAAARAVQGRGAAAWAASSACRKTIVGRHPFPGPGLAIRILERRHAREDRGAAARRRDLSRGHSRGRTVRRHLAGVRRAACRCAAWA